MSGRDGGLGGRVLGFTCFSRKKKKKLQTRKTMKEVNNRSGNWNQLSSSISLQQCLLVHGSFYIAIDHACQVIEFICADIY